MMAVSRDNAKRRSSAAGQATHLLPMVLFELDGELMVLFTTPL